MVFIDFFSFPVLLFRCLFSPRFSPFHDAKVVQLVEVCKALCAGKKNILSSKAVRYFLSGNLAYIYMQLHSIGIEKGERTRGENDKKKVVQGEKRSFEKGS